MHFHFCHFCSKSKMYLTGTASLEPKGFVPYKNVRGQVPRKIVVERKRRLNEIVIDTSFDCRTPADGYVGSNDHNVYALDARTGEKVWNYPTGGYVFSSPTVVLGTVCVGSEDRNVYALQV